MRRRQAFTLVETLIVVLILAICATICMDAIGNTEATFRAERAAREAVTAIRYARMLSISANGTYGVRFSQSAGTFQVYQTTGTNVVPQAMSAGGTYVVKLSQPELQGVTMSVTLANDTTDPFDLAYTAGNTTNAGTVTFAYAGMRKTVTIPAVGDPTIP
ncbi:MAG: pilus assembly FimT family protein [Phycisphaerae bacterium]